MKQSQPMSKPKLSIVVPAKDEKDFIRRCLDSIVKQLTNEVQAIVIDDGSTDGTTEILKEYFDTPIEFYRQDKSQGVSEARNEGMARATGKYITFLDADDEYSRGAIEKMLNATKLNKDIVQFNHWRYYDELGTMYQKYTNQRGSYSFFDRPQMWCMVWNKIYRTQFIKDNGLSFKKGLQFGEDELFNVKCFFNEPTYYHEKGATVIKHFENKQSICHQLTPERVHKQDETLVSLYWSMIYKGANEKMVDELEGIIREHRRSKTFQNIGLRKEK